MRQSQHKWSAMTFSPQANLFALLKQVSAAVLLSLITMGFNASPSHAATSPNLDTVTYSSSEVLLADNQNAQALDPINDYFNTLQFDESIEEKQDSLWDRIRAGYGMPDVDSKYTAKHEQWYASRPEYVERMMERSKKYLFHIVEEVESRGMPLEIALLPMVESAFNPKAMSSSKAAGIWQFMPATGKYFGLKQNYWSDSRRDVTEATNAALTYLQRLHGMFGSWDLALAAYNAGEGTIAKAIEKNRRLGLATDYASLSLPEETRNYVPKLQAIKNIVFNPEQYGLSLAHIPNTPYFATVKAPKQIDAKLAAELAGISQEEFNALNPSFNRPVIVANTDLHQLLLPTDAATHFVNNLANYDKPLSNWQTYKPKRGERIDTIANHFNISLSELRAVNNLSAHSKTSPRRALLVPLSGHPQSLETAAGERNFEDLDQLADAADAIDEQLEPLRQTTVRYKVRKGDTLTSLAKHYGMPIGSVMSLNHLRNKKISLGQTLVFKQSSPRKVKVGKVKGARGHTKRMALKAKSRHKVTLKHGGKHKAISNAKKSRFKAKHR